MFQAPDGHLDQVDAGRVAAFGEAKTGESEFAREQASQRMRARMDSTCAKGSMPAAGSSSIRTSSTVKPGPGEKIQVNGADV